MLYILTEQEKKNVRETVNLAKKLVSIDGNTLIKETKASNIKAEKKIETVKLKLKEKGIDLDKAPKPKYDYTQDFSFSGCVVTVKEWIKDIIKNFSFVRMTKAIILFLFLFGMWRVLGEAFLMLFDKVPIFKSVFMKLASLSGVSRGSLESIALAVINGCLIAPICEEGTKYLSVKLGITKENWLIFNTAEFTKYVFWGDSNFAPASFRSQLETNGLKTALAVLPANIVVRFICVLGHTLYTKVHTDTGSKIKSGGLRAILMMIFHAVWNFSALVSPFGALTTGIMYLFQWGIFPIIYMKLLRKKKAPLQKKVPNKKPVKAPRPSLAPA